MPAERALAAHVRVAPGVEVTEPAAGPAPEENSNE
jgi:hypothetical protein